jgi:hypothetical protein
MTSVVVGTITTAGIAAIEAAGTTGPLVNITNFKIGDAYGFTPLATDTDIHGTQVYPPIPDTGGLGTSPYIAYFIQSNNTIIYRMYLPETSGGTALSPMLIGNIGIYTNTGTLFALVAYSIQYQKVAATGDVQFYDIVIQLNGQTVSGTLNLTVLNPTYLSLPFVTTESGLPSPSSTVYNAYIVNTYSVSGDTALAVLDSTLNTWQYIANYSDIFKNGDSFNGVYAVSTSETLPSSYTGALTVVVGTSGAINLTLPTTASLRLGSKYTLINRSAYTVTLLAAGSDTFSIAPFGSGTTTSVVMQPGDDIVITSQTGSLTWQINDGTASLQYSEAFVPTVAFNQGFNSTLHSSAPNLIASTQYVKNWGNNFSSMVAQGTFPVSLTDVNMGSLIQAYGTTAGTINLPSITSYSLYNGQCITFKNDMSSGTALTLVPGYTGSGHQDLINESPYNSVATSLTLYPGDTVTLAVQGTTTYGGNVVGVWLISGGTAGLQFSQTLVPTLPGSDNSNRIAYTAWVNTAIGSAISTAVSNINTPVSFSASGYVKLTGGLILQWTQGASHTGSSEITEYINFPIAFPNGCLKPMIGTAIGSPTNLNDVFYQAISWSTTQVYVQRQGANSYSGYDSALVYAIGY